MIWDMYYKLRFISLILLPIFTFAQEDLSFYQSKYPDNNELCLTKNADYSFEVKRGKLNMFREESSQDLVLRRAASASIKDKVMSSQFEKLIDFRAKTISKEKKSYPVQKLVEENDFGGYVFHDGIIEKSFNYTNVEEGSIKYKYTRTQFTDPHILRSFHFADFNPIEEAKLTVKVDKDIDLGFKIFNAPENLEYSKKEKRKYVLHTWKVKNLDKLDYEPNMLGFLHISPHIEFFIKSYKNRDDEQVKVLSSLGDLYTLYQGFVSKIENNESETLREKALEITKDLSSEEEKVRAIFSWVQNHVKYIAFEGGYEGFIPRGAAQILESRYGDCKDMANIIYQMSQYVDIENVHLTWIGTRERPYTYRDLHTPLVDNHMIATYKKGDEYIFLDATSEHVPFGYPSEFIQGKQAMMALDKDHYELIHVPVLKGDKNKRIESIHFKIDEEKITGKGTLTLTGYSRIHVLYALTDKNKIEQKEAVKNILKKGSNKFLLEDYEYKNEQNELTFDYTFNVDNYVTNLGDKKYINLFLDKPLKSLKIKKDRVHDFILNYQHAKVNQYTIEIPDDFSFDFIPENDQYSCSLGDFTIEYKKLDENHLELTSNCNIHTLQISKDKFEEWNEFIKRLNQNYSESISIKKK